MALSSSLMHPLSIIAPSQIAAKLGHGTIGTSLSVDSRPFHMVRVLKGAPEWQLHVSPVFGDWTVPLLATICAGNSLSPMALLFFHPSGATKLRVDRNQNKSALVTQNISIPADNHIAVRENHSHSCGFVRIITRHFNFTVNMFYSNDREWCFAVKNKSTVHSNLTRVPQDEKTHSARRSYNRKTSERGNQ